MTGGLNTVNHCTAERVCLSVVSEVKRKKERNPTDTASHLHNRYV